MAVGIGLRSTGLLVFTGRLISAFTGLIFTVMAARSLIPAQFGLWEVIVTIVTFSSYPVGVVAYWATRDVARGRLVGRTALAVGFLLSGGGLGLYFIFAFFTYSQAASSLVPFLLGALLVPLAYWSAVASSIVQGFRPSSYGYSLVISEFAKLAVAYEALFVYRLAVEGVIIALLTSYFVQAAVSTYLVRGANREKLQLSELRRWASVSWVPAISYLPTVFAVADTYVAFVLFGPAIVGYFQVAFIIATVVGYSSALAFGLYPLLLKGGGEKLPAMTIDFSLLFSIPMAVGGVVLASPILFLLGSRYLPGSLALAVLSVTFVVATISNVMDQTLLGTEKADVAEGRTFRTLAKSNLIYVPVVNVATAITYVAMMVVVLRYSFSQGLSTSTTLGLWAAVAFISGTVFLAVKTLRTRRYAKLRPGANVIYYPFSAAAMGAVLYLVSGPVLDRGLSTLLYGVRLLGVVGLGLVVYFGLLYGLDRKFREFVGEILGR